MDDLFYIIVTLLVLACIIVFSLYLLNAVTPTLEALSPENSEERNMTTHTITSASTVFTSTFDSGFIIVFVMMVVSSMILGTLLPTNPIFFIPFIFVMVLLISITAIVSGLWTSFSTDPNMATTVVQLTYIPFVMDNLTLLTTGLGFMLSIVIYVSFRRI